MAGRLGASAFAESHDPGIPYEVIKACKGVFI